MNVLISSLGESPAVVTETVDAVEREEHIKIDQVVTIGTTKWEVELSQDVLREEFNRFDGGRIAYISDQIAGEDLLSEVSPVPYETYGDEAG